MPSFRTTYSYGQTKLDRFSSTYLKGFEFSGSSFSGKVQTTRFMMTIVLCDDHHLVRQGLRALLSMEKDVALAGECSSGEEAVEKVKSLSPDILLLDLIIPRIHGLEVIKLVKSMTKVVVLTMERDHALVVESFHNGARGYILKESGSEELVHGLRQVQQGAKYLCRKLSQGTLRNIINASNAQDNCPDPYDCLNAKERLILKCMSQGMTCQEIAKLFVIDEKTAVRHKSGIMRKLFLKNEMDVFKFAVRRNLISV